MTDRLEINVPRHLRTLGQVLVPLRDRVREALRAPSPAVSVWGNPGDLIGDIASRSAGAIDAFGRRFNALQSRIVCRPEATDGEIRAVVDRIEDVVEDLAKAYERARALGFGPEDAEGKRLLVAALRGILTELERIFADTVEALTDPAAVAARRGIRPADDGDVYLELSFTVETPPEVAALEHWCKARAATVPRPARKSEGLGFWATLGLAVVGVALLDGLFDDDCDG